MGLFHVAIRGRDRKHLVALRPKFRVIVVGYREDKRGAVVDAFIPSEKIPYLRRKGYDVTLIEEVTAHDRDRQAEGRAAVEVRLKEGRYGDVIWGGGYLTSDEVEKAMVLGEKNHAGYCERIPLPNLTWEKRRCHALRIGTGGGKGRMAICLMAGTHGREWGGPDILVYFGIRLLRAYRDKKPIKLGRRTFTAAQVRWLVENREIILYPLVNPDGRHFSMERHPMWRKNRRPAPKGRSHKSIGVDLNRNFPFLWHFDRHFAPGTVQSSRKPGEYETYIGPREASEPETRNVIWLLDQCDNIRYFVDLHSYGETILHSWGSDNNQSDNPRMSFRNKRYDGKRGLLDDDVYREYIPAADEKEARRWPAAWPPPSARSGAGSTLDSSRWASIRRRARRMITSTAATWRTRRKPRCSHSRWNGDGAVPPLRFIRPTRKCGA